MKWYKHISDSIDDPFIFSLMEEFRSDGYLVFFGVLEIYSREFQTKDDWKLTEKLSYFRHKLLISQSKFKKILSKISKWEVEYFDDKVSIFIPKFRELLDESTLKKLRESEKSCRNNSGTVPKTEATDKEVDKDLDKDKEEEKIKKVFPSDAPAYRLSTFLFDSILSCNPESRLHAFENGKKESTVQNWAKDIDLLLRIDHREPSTVEEVITFATHDDFWRANILSGKKLRDKWDTLVLQKGRLNTKKEDKWKDD
jgi:hypothetical protein